MIYMLYRMMFASGSEAVDRIQPLTLMRAIMAFIIAFLCVWFTGPRMIKGLYRRGMRDLPRTYMDAFVFSKTGTPTMGGIIIVTGILASALLMCDLNSPPTALLFLATGFFAGIGALDDFLKTRRKSSDGGLSRRFKLVAQGLFGLFFAIMVLSDGTSPFLTPGMPDDRTRLFMPIISPLFGFYPDLGWFGYGLLIFCAFLLISNAVNFADGLDGLAIVPAAFAVAVYGIIAYMLGKPSLATSFGLVDYPWLDPAIAKLNPAAIAKVHVWMDDVAIYSAAVLGSATGFLWFNAYPAQVFMGDTGSMALGGTLAALAILTRQELLFLVVGAIFVYEFVSVFIQDQIGLNRLGRRLLYRAPAHHSFQHQGVAETKVVLRFWIVSLLFALIAFAALSTGPRFVTANRTPQHGGVEGPVETPPADRPTPR